MLLRLAWTLLLLCGGTIPAMAACSSYEPLKYESHAAFMNTAFGTLGIPRPGMKDRMIVFAKASCYDLSTLGLPDLLFHINNRDAEEKPSFLAANVVKAYDYRMAGQQPFQVQFWRNGNAVDSTAKWVRVDPENLPEGARFDGAFGYPLDARYKPDEKLQFAALGDFLAGSSSGLIGSDPLTSAWHAMIVIVSDSRARFLLPGTGFRVEENTRFGIEPIGADGMDLSAAPKGTVISRLNLIKFARSPTSTTPLSVLQAEIDGASCLFLRYRIDGSSNAFFQAGNTSGDFMVLRLKAGASC